MLAKRARGARATSGRIELHRRIAKRPVEQGGERLWLAGDGIVHELQLVNPQVRSRFDADAVAASRSRTALLSGARQDSTPLGTAHLLAPWVLPTGE